ncbi:MAG: hypothetical protein QXE64_02540 [Candidatus Pacearchaeota archaeon]
MTKILENLEKLLESKESKKSKIKKIVMPMLLALSIGLSPTIELTATNPECPKAEQFWGQRKEEEYKNSIEKSEFASGTVYTIKDEELQKALSYCFGVTNPVTAIGFFASPREGEALISVLGGGSIQVNLKSLPKEDYTNIMELLNPTAYDIKFKDKQGQEQGQEVMVAKPGTIEEKIIKELEKEIKEEEARKRGGGLEEEIGLKGGEGFEEKEGLKEERGLEEEKEFETYETEAEKQKPKEKKIIKGKARPAEGSKNSVEAILSYDSKGNIEGILTGNVELDKNLSLTGELFNTSGQVQDTTVTFDLNSKYVEGGFGLNFKRWEKYSFSESPNTYYLYAKGWLGKGFSLGGYLNLATKSSQDIINYHSESQETLYDRICQNDPFEICSVTQGTVENFVNIKGLSKTDERFIKFRGTFLNEGIKVGGGHFLLGLLFGIEESKAKNKLSLVQTINNKVEGENIVYINGEEVSRQPFSSQNYVSENYELITKRTHRVFPIGAILGYENDKLVVEAIPVVNIGPEIKGTDHIEGILYFSQKLGPNSLVLNYLKDDSKNTASVWYVNPSYIETRNSFYLNYQISPEKFNKLNEYRLLTKGRNFYGGVDISYGKDQKPAYTFTVGYGNDKFGVKGSYTLDRNGADRIGLCGRGSVNESIDIFGCGEIDGSTNFGISTGVEIKF